MLCSTDIKIYYKATTSLCQKQYEIFIKWISHLLVQRVKYGQQLTALVGNMKGPNQNSIYFDRLKAKLANRYMN